MSDLLKGICRLGVVPMYEKPSYEATLFSELLFGEHYEVLNSDKEWYKIKLVFDGSEGWIHQNQHFSISDAYFEQINLSDYKVCTDISGTIFFQKKYVNILLGSILPISSNELFKMEEQIAFNGESKSLSQRRDFDYLKEVVEKYRHASYKKGGKTAFGIDEAGFIQQTFKLCGYTLPRTIQEQLKKTEERKDLASLEEGEIVYLGDRKITAALICLGNSQFIGVIDGQVIKLSNLDTGKQKIRTRTVFQKSY